MRLEDLDDFIDEHSLLLYCKQKPGIYCIAVDMKIVYIGKSKNVY
nr:MAG TPA: UvrABC system protein C [Caudoviricetes sp.]